MRLMAVALAVILALVVGCSKEPPATATEEPAAGDELISGEDFEAGEDVAQPAAEAGEAGEAEEGEAEPAAGEGEQPVH